MYVIEIPTNKPCIREDMADMMFATEKGKYDAIVKFIEEVHATGEPILVGTISVESNERLSKMLTKAKLPHEVLNAKNHLREAEIIAKAGEKGAITIATNMAGRGTDIKLGEGVKELGGLCVLGTERHESRRIDNQLRGRAGRQGDPGYSQFFISFEDELMRRFGTDKIKTMIQSVGYDETQPIRSKMFSKSVETAQKKVEGNNYDMRKTLLDYDNIVSEQRKIIYEKRNEILDTDDIHSLIIEIFKDYVFEFVDSHMAPEGYLTENDLKAIENNFNTILKNQKLDLSDYKDKKEQETIDYVTEIVIKDYEEKIKDVPKEMLEDFERYIALRVIDDAWVEHINSMEHLKEGIGLRGYAQTNPLQAYALEGYDIFDKMQDNIDANIVNFLLKLNVNINRKPVQKGIANDGKESLKKEPAANKKKKIGRNDLCPCGSGLKYKNCCGK